MTDETQNEAISHTPNVAANVETIRQLVQDIKDAQAAGSGGGTVDLSGVNAKLDAIAGTLNTIKSQSSSNGSGISQLQTSVDTLQAAVMQIQADLEGITAPSTGGTPPPRPPASNS